MQKNAIILLVAVFAIWILVAAVKGSAAQYQRAETIRQCQMDTHCFYDPNN